MVEKTGMVEKRIVEEILRLNPKVKEKELSWRIDGRLEWICSHGVGHTVYDLKRNDFIHGGCDDCCKEIKVYNPSKENEAEEWYDEYKRRC